MNLKKLSVFEVLSDIWRHESRRRTVEWGFVLLVALIPLSLYTSWIVRFAPPNPVEDDVPAIAVFLNRYDRAGSLSERLALLIAQNNEHRLAIPRLEALALSRLEGGTDWRHLIFLGNVAWALTLVLLGFIFAAGGMRPWLFLPLPFLWFTFTHRENAIWAMTAISNYGSVLLALAAITTTMSRSRTAFLVTLLLTGLACYCSAAGLMLIPALAVGFVLQQRWKALAAFGVYGAVLAGLYLCGYVRPTNNPAVIESVLNYTRLHSIRGVYTHVPR